MTARLWVAAMALATQMGGCADNESPGNDREAQLDRPSPPAEMAEGDAAIAGVETSLLHPELIIDSDLAAVTLEAGMCEFRYTRVDFPSFLYSSSGTSALIKLNGKLVPMSGSGGGGFTSGGVRAQIREIAEGEGDELRQSELILMLPGAPNELGYRGFSSCPEAA